MTIHVSGSREWREWRALHRQLVLQRPSAPSLDDREMLRARGGALLAEMLALVQDNEFNRIGAAAEIDQVCADAVRCPHSPLFLSPVVWVVSKAWLYAVSYCAWK